MQQNRKVDKNPLGGKLFKTRSELAALYGVSLQTFRNYIAPLKLAGRQRLSPKAQEKIIGLLGEP